MGILQIREWNGTKEELVSLLQSGVKITSIEVEENEYVIEFQEKRVGRPQKIRKEDILTQRAAGMSYGEIARKAGCSKSYVIKVCRNETIEDLRVETLEEHELKCGTVHLKGIKLVHK